MSVLAPSAPRLRPDLDSLQGVWESVAGPRPARLLVAGRHYTFEFVGGALYMGTFDIAAGHMDMHIAEGPPEHAGRFVRCLYALDGGVLRFCAGRPGSDRRPADFADVDDRKQLSLVFRRVNRRR
jgi:hypothetical protein